MHMKGYRLNKFYVGELGLGFDEPKSATKPTRNIPLVGLEVFEYVLSLSVPCQVADLFM